MNLSKKHLKQIYRRRNGFGGTTVMLSKFFHFSNTPLKFDVKLVILDVASKIVAPKSARPAFKK